MPSSTPLWRTSAYAEQTCHILPLGLWVLDTACLQLRQWAMHPTLARITLSVNVSAYQLRQANFFEQVLSTVQRTGIDASRLKLELTESMLGNDMDDLITKMTALQARSVGFSLHDFGTGYSSLSYYLRRLPLDQLKIDQSFVRDVLSEPHGAAIGQTVIALGQSLNLTVISERVETEGQRAFLAQGGCHGFQGYLFSRPLPIAAFDALVAPNGYLFPPDTDAAAMKAACAKPRPGAARGTSWAKCQATAGVAVRRTRRTLKALAIRTPCTNASPRNTALKRPWSSSTPNNKGDNAWPMSKPEYTMP